MGETADERQEESDNEIQDSLDDALRTIVAGFVATALMTVLLLAVQSAYWGEFEVFETLANIAGARESFVLGLFLFFLGGTIAWPLMFISLGTFLPGKTRMRQGVVFALVLWVGFIVAFSRELTGLDFVVFFLVSLALHAIYGYVLGFVSARLTGNRVVSGPAV